MTEDYEKRRAEAESYNAMCRARAETRPLPKGQKYAHGTRVWIARDLGGSKSHFLRGKWATVVDTYARLYGEKDYEWDGDGVDLSNEYVLDIDEEGERAWYAANELTLTKEEDETRYVKYVLGIKKGSGNRLIGSYPEDRLPPDVELHEPFKEILKKMFCKKDSV